jgi:hypothetical protein
MRQLSSGRAIILTHLRHLLERSPHECPDDTSLVSIIGSFAHPRITGAFRPSWRDDVQGLGLSRSLLTGIRGGAADDGFRW